MGKTPLRKIGQQTFVSNARLKNHTQTPRHCDQRSDEAISVIRTLPSASLTPDGCLLPPLPARAIVVGAKFIPRAARIRH